VSATVGGVWARPRLLAFNLGLVLVGVAVVLPWAEVAGERYRGPAFANLLLRLPEVRPLGDHLTLVAWTWYLIPLGGLVAWGAQFTRWPPRVGWPSRAGLVVVTLATVAVSGWLAVRDVGFPAAGPVVALVGAGVAVAAAAGRAATDREPG
jgi:hypothetical protein